MIALTEIVRVLKPGGKALVTVWAKEQEIENKKSTYISKQNRTTSVETASVPENFAHTDEIIVHKPRTEFQKPDCLVPWTKTNEKFLRYYHVFVKDELEHILSHIPQIRILHSFNDEGNWCVIFMKSV